MTREEAIHRLKVKKICLERMISGIGTDADCNNHYCGDCSLCYEQGNIGEQKEALDVAIDTMEQYNRLKAITSKSDYVLTAIEMGLPLIIGFIIGKCF